MLSFNPPPFLEPAKIQLSVCDFALIRYPLASSIRAFERNHLSAFSASVNIFTGRGMLAVKIFIGCKQRELVDRRWYGIPLCCLCLGEAECGNQHTPASVNSFFMNGFFNWSSSFIRDTCKSPQWRDFLFLPLAINHPVVCDKIRIDRLITLLPHKHGYLCTMIRWMIHQVDHNILDIVGVRIVGIISVGEFTIKIVCYLPQIQSTAFPVFRHVQQTFKRVIAPKFYVRLGRPLMRWSHKYCAASTWPHQLPRILGSLTCFLNLTKHTLVRPIVVIVEFLRNTFSRYLNICFNSASRSSTQPVMLSRSRVADNTSCSISSLRKLPTCRPPEESLCLIGQIHA